MSARAAAALVLLSGCVGQIVEPNGKPGDPTLGDTVSGGDPATAGDPNGGDPTPAGDPNGGDPTSAGDPNGGDPTAAGDPNGGDPTAGDPFGGDPSAGDPSAGDPSSGDPDILLLPPEGLEGAPANSAVGLAWRSCAGALTYNLYWSESPGVTTASATVADISSGFVHRGLTNGTPYSYAVTAVYPGGESGLSNEVRQKLAARRPATLGQAARIPGVTPAAVSLLLVHLKRHGELRQAG
jgi:hypothetical protein